MILKQFTIKKIFPLALKKNSEGKEWNCLEIVLRDDSMEFGDEAVVCLRNENALHFSFTIGDRVNAWIRMKTFEYDDKSGEHHANTHLSCWRIEPASAQEA